MILKKSWEDISSLSFRLTATCLSRHTNGLMTFRVCPRLYSCLCVRRQYETRESGGGSGDFIGFSRRNKYDNVKKRPFQRLSKIIFTTLLTPTVASVPRNVFGVYTFFFPVRHRGQIMSFDGPERLL